MVGSRVVVLRIIGNVLSFLVRDSVAVSRGIRIVGVGL